MSSGSRLDQSEDPERGRIRVIDLVVPLGNRSCPTSTNHSYLPIVLTGARLYRGCFCLTHSGSHILGNPGFHCRVENLDQVAKVTITKGVDCYFLSILINHRGPDNLHIVLASCPMEPEQGKGNILTTTGYM